MMAMRTKLCFVGLSGIVGLIVAGSMALAEIGPGLPTPEAVKPAEVRPDAQTSPADYVRAVELTANMVANQRAQKLAAKNDLQILNLTWEDTGRYKDSAVGPNISDMTIQVATRERHGKKILNRVTCMPVIRFPNFSDTTCDLDPRDFTLMVGNQDGDSELRRVSLYDFLDEPTAYLTDPESWKKKAFRRRSLLADRDSKVLVSAQACFLPIPAGGEATFNPVLFNYQSYEGDPAVLTILATPKGTSVTVIDNKRDAFDDGAAWGQRLFHNANGERASLTGQRQSEMLAREPGNQKVSPEKLGNRDTGLNMVLLIQVPLKQKRPMQGNGFLSAEADAFGGVLEKSAASPDVENAVIGYGEVEGPFTEIDGLPIQRDPKFPVRVTVQFYKATSNGEVGAEDFAAIKKQINQIYQQSDAVGSLVTAGRTGRVTEYEGVKKQPASWWKAFWKRHQANTGDSPEKAVRKLRKLLGYDGPLEELPCCDLYLRDVLRTAE